MGEKSTNNKLKILGLFSNRFTYAGCICILISIIIELLCTDTSTCRGILFLISILSNTLSTLGIALFIGSIFDLAKNSDEFVKSVSHILSNIVISKAFLNTLSGQDKRQALELILQPTGDQLQQYSNINHYFQKKIDESVAMLDTNFKSHLSLSVEVFKENDIVKARSRLQYRIYKINNAYEPIQTWLEHPDSEILSTRIICNSEIIEIKNNEHKPMDDELNHTQIPYSKNYFEIPTKYQDAPYVTVQYDILEPGNDHWINYIWTSLTPYDGLNFALFCKDDLIIKQHNLFDNGRGYTVTLDDNKKAIRILSTDWLNSYTGISIIIGEGNKLL